MNWLTVTEYLCHKWRLLCPVCGNHNPAVLSSFMTLFAYNGVQHIPVLCCVFVLSVFVLCTNVVSFSGLSIFLLTLRYSLTLIYHRVCNKSNVHVRWVPRVEQELIYLPEHLSSHPFFLHVMVGFVFFVLFVLSNYMSQRFWFRVVMYSTVST